MSSLQSILNPEDGKRKTVKLILNLPDDDIPSPGGPPSSPGTTPTSEFDEISVDSAPQNYLHNQNHEPHPNCPDSLSCLPDTNGRPQHTLPVILRCAILGSPNQRLTIREIYAAMEAKYNYYTSAGQTWKQSVRHHLSLNRLFERQSRPATDPGFGSYWTVNLSAPPGTKRPRKRGRNKATDEDGEPRKGGRPRTILPTRGPEDTEQAPDITLRPVTIRPLPRIEFDMPEISSSTYKYPYVWPPQCRTEAAGQSNRIPSFQGVMDGSDEFNSEETDMPIHPMDRRTELHGLSAYHPPNIVQPQYSLPPLSVLQNGGDESSILEQMQAEMDTLRRQSADAISLSLKLSEQLSTAQEETSQMRTALQEVEEMLKEESRRRRQAEKALSGILSDSEEGR